MLLDDKYLIVKEIALRIDKSNKELKDSIIELNKINNNLIAEIESNKVEINRLYSERRMLEDVIEELDGEISSLRSRK